METQQRQQSPSGPLPIPVLSRTGARPSGAAVAPVMPAATTAAPLKVPSVPPAFLFRMVVAFREWLLGLTRKLVPAPIAVYERLTGFWYTEMIHTVTRLQIADH